jgi:hypothetical protein
MKKDIQKANDMVNELREYSYQIDDLAITYLVEGNLE